MLCWLGRRRKEGDGVLGWEREVDGGYKMGGGAEEMRKKGYKAIILQDLGRGGARSGTYNKSCLHYYVS